MADAETKVTTTGTEGTTQTAEPTLEDVYKSAATELQPAPQQQQPAPHQQPAVPSAPYIPDPYDTNAFKAYLAEQAKGHASTQDALRQVAGLLTQDRMEKAKVALEADLKSAVETVNEVVGHPKPKVIEAMIDAKAREDTRFKSLWENRSRNPAAWNNALKAVAREFASDLSVKVDPTLRASQTARKLAQSQMATTEGPKSDTEEWESLSPADQQRKMDRMLNNAM